MKALPTTYTIDFTPCTGFGATGRMAALRASCGAGICSGAGATDDEATLEALLDFGMAYDDAFDAVGQTLRAAAYITRS